MLIDASTAAASCSAAAQQGRAVDIAGTTNAAPLGDRGAIVDGTYVLTAATDYGRGANNPKLAVLASTLLIHGTTFERIDTIGAGQETRTAGTATVVTDFGGALSWTEMCRSPADDAGTRGTVTASYTATSTSLTLLFPPDSDWFGLVYTRQ